MSLTDTEPWPRLLKLAREVQQKAYSPYSHYAVGVAGLVDDGRVVTGCNVENASFGLTLCAECGMVSELIRSGGGRLVAVVCVGGPRAQIVVPCGRCRQLLFEHGGNDLEVWMPSGIMKMSEVLPQAFGPADLENIESEA